MIISGVKNLLKFFLIDNSDKFVIELIGNPGSGKTTLINKINGIENNKIFRSYKKNYFLYLIKLLCFLIHKNIGIALVIIKFIFIGKYFLSDKNKISFKSKFLRLRKVFLILFLMLFKIYSSKNKVIFVESILHQLINNDFDQKALIKDILILYGKPKIKFVFLDCSVDESVTRMVKRGDKIKLDESTLKRYTQSNNTHKHLYEVLDNEYKNFIEIEKPLLIDSKINSVENAKNLILKLNI
jgi:energy-coupling factor transporter ATP-binding protein EcfA2